MPLDCVNTAAHFGNERPVSDFSADQAPEIFNIYLPRIRFQSEPCWTYTVNAAAITIAMLRKASELVQDSTNSDIQAMAPVRSDELLPASHTGAFRAERQHAASWSSTARRT
jgi:hypothetical protein